jgi:hypothetical protein
MTMADAELLILDSFPSCCLSSSLGSNVFFQSFTYCESLTNHPSSRPQLDLTFLSATGLSDLASGGGGGPVGLLSAPVG